MTIKIDNSISLGTGDARYLKLDQTTPQVITATDTTITASDEIYYGDATDSSKLKKDTVQGILDLVPSPDLSAYVPYTGATGDVDLGAYDISANNLSGTNTGDQDLSGLVPYENVSLETIKVGFGSVVGDDDVSWTITKSNNPTGPNYPMLTPKDDNTFNGVWRGLIQGGIYAVPGANATTTGTFNALFTDTTLSKGMFMSIAPHQGDYLLFQSLGTWTNPHASFQNLPINCRFVYASGGSTSANFATDLSNGVMPEIGDYRISGSSTTATSGLIKGNFNNTKANAQGMSIISGGAATGSTNRLGGELVLSGGRSTGTGTSTITFKTATAGSSGTTISDPTTKWTIDGAGSLLSGTNGTSAFNLTTTGTIQAQFKSNDGTPGATGTIDLTSATSITVKNGLITGWA